MADTKVTLTRAQLDELLLKLDEVMAEAERLRRHVTGQLTAHGSDDRQELGSPRNPAAAANSRRQR